MVMINYRINPLVNHNLNPVICIGIVDYLCNIKRNPLLCLPAVYMNMRLSLSNRDPLAVQRIVW